MGWWASFKAHWREHVTWKHVVHTVIFILLFAAISGLIVWLTAAGHTAQFLVWVDEQGIWGHVMFAVAFILIALPHPIAFAYATATIGCGFVFGFPLGMLTVVVGVTLGVLLCITLFRNVFRAWVEGKVQGRPKVDAVKRMLEGSPITATVLIRLSPFPHGLQNVVLAASDTPFLLVQVCSFFGLLPYQAVLVYGGSIVDDVADLFTQERSTADIIILVVQVLVLVGIVVGMLVVATKVLRRMSKETEAAERRQQLDEANRSSSTSMTSSRSTDSYDSEGRELSPLSASEYVGPVSAAVLDRSSISDSDYGDDSSTSVAICSSSKEEDGVA